MRASESTGHWQTYDSSAFFYFEIPGRTRRETDWSFKAAPHPAVDRICARVSARNDLDQLVELRLGERRRQKLGRDRLLHEIVHAVNHVGIDAGLGEEAVATL